MVNFSKFVTLVNAVQPSKATAKPMLVSLAPAGRVTLSNDEQPQKTLSKLLTLVNFSKFVILFNDLQSRKVPEKLMPGA